jgi:hypothetical protein
MSSVPREYEFSQEQNVLFSGMSSRMRLVGLILAVFGVLNLLVALGVVLAIYRNNLPADYVESVVKKAGDATGKDVKEMLDKLPANNVLWWIAIAFAVNGLLWLLMGVWTRSAAHSFQKIVDTQGHDISLLMDALGALNRMYSLIYTLIVIGFLVILIALGLYLYSHFAR